MIQFGRTDCAKSALVEVFGCRPHQGGAADRGRRFHAVAASRPTGRWTGRVELRSRDQLVLVADWGRAFQLGDGFHEAGN